MLLPEGCTPGLDICTLKVLEALELLLALGSLLCLPLGLGLPLALARVLALAHAALHLAWVGHQAGGPRLLQAAALASGPTHGNCLSTSSSLVAAWWQAGGRLLLLDRQSLGSGRPERRPAQQGARCVLVDHASPLAGPQVVRPSPPLPVFPATDSAWQHLRQGLAGLVCNHSNTHAA